VPTVWLEHKGLFRFRPQLIVNGDLGLGNGGSSGVPLPLEAATGQEKDASTLSWADMRLRWEPTLHLGDAFAVHAGFDLLDGVVLGSSWADAGGVPAFGVTSETAASPSAGHIGWSDALEVRSLYGEWHAFDMIDVTVGRVPDSFGLGLVRNAGDCDDCDFGNVVDMASVALSLSGFRLQAAWEWTAVGATTDLVSANDRGIGQAKDLGEDDDVTTYTLRAGRFPVTDLERAARTKILDEDRGWAFDWALFSAFTNQHYSSSEQVEETSLECRPDAQLANGQPVQDYDCVRLFRRDAFFWRPGVWLKLERHPDLLSSFRLELELAAVIGDIKHPQRLLEDDSSEAKDFQGLGGALELEWRDDTLAAGIDIGYASGDNGQYVGVLDGQNVVEPDDDAYVADDTLRANHRVTSFFFSRDYLVDLILFREILGTVTNAVYFKPWISKTLLQGEDTTLSVRFDALYALAPRPSGTPGDGGQWGVELDAKAVFETRAGFRATLAAGALIPLDALDHPVTGEAPEPAFAIRSMLGWSF